ncbi:MAG: helix-hairpin-helix domain-containing protein [Sedimentibacter sp.]|uniref:helix-hairpin-helix domain-containing protein n=1 Tax=Sedimentibacter sp. TaxID=1960295 RepID=UPI002980D91C|nr:helix-hairpin-helix domain-containing protein [Sedimentibacter sp.]MDW5300561.1 helix-hairpin-helix domain-containing protein [Sedimentibacter sp.]
MNNSIYKKGLAVVLIIALFIMTAVGIKLSSKESEINYTSNDNIEENEENVENTHNSTEYIFVDIDGAVKNPGVYQFREGDRINDAIMKAGGLKETAFTKNLNKARKLVDGEKIYILEKGENIVDLPLYNEENEGKIDINNASKEILMSLSGIGEIYAQRIIEYRNKQQFTSIEEIKNIEGIGDKTFDKIKDSITVK